MPNSSATTPPDRSKFLRSYALLTLVLVTTAGVAVSHADEIDEWLMKLDRASGNLNYEGTFIYVHGTNIEVMRVFHQANDNVVRERIYSLNGAAREIVRDMEQVWCYLPEKQVGVHQYRQSAKPNFPDFLPQRLGDLREHYEIELGPTDRIADRAARQILIRPKDEYRYGLDLSVDVETGLLLKAILIDALSQPIEQYMFTDLRIGEPIPLAQLEPATAKSSLTWFRDSNKPEVDLAVPKSEWRVKQVPSGTWILTPDGQWRQK